MKQIAPLIALVCSLSAAENPPNILFIMADDLGYSDTNIYGHSAYYETPNIDALAEKSLVFTNAHSASPLCSPTRASTMTGQNPARIGSIQANTHTGKTYIPAQLQKNAKPYQGSIAVLSANRLPLENVTYAEAFKEAGYATAHFGKWHLGQGAGYEPKDRGFDIDIPHTPSAPGPGGGYLAPWRFIHDPEFKDAGTPGEFIDEWMADRAADFISANKDQPFFINFWAYSPHTPITNAGRQDYAAYFSQKGDPNGRHDDHLYASILKSFDESIGKLLQALEDNGVAENTIVIFTSDNGGLVDYTDNWPLRSGKASTYQGGTGVPLVVYDPRYSNAGKTTDALVSSTDLYPTFLELCSLPLRPEQHLDAISFADIIRDKTNTGEREELVVPFYALNSRIYSYVLGDTSSIRKDDYKLMRYWFGNADGTDHRYELYHLRSDVHESEDLADSMPELVETLS